MRSPIPSWRRLSRAGRAAWLWGPPLVEMALIFSVSSMPSPPAPPGGLSDKWLHAVVYGMLGALLLRAFADGRWAGVRGSTAALAALVATLYGVTDELHQRFVPPRSPEVLDTIMDGIGASVAAGSTWAWSIIRRFSAARSRF